MKNEMMSVKGDTGAKKIIQKNKNKILYVQVKNSGVTLDFDTKKDFNSS